MAKQPWGEGSSWPPLLPAWESRGILALTGGYKDHCNQKPMFSLLISLSKNNLLRILITLDKRWNGGLFGVLKIEWQVKSHCLEGTCYPTTLLLLLLNQIAILCNTTGRFHQGAGNLKKKKRSSGCFLIYMKVCFFQMSLRHLCLAHYILY